MNSQDQGQSGHTGHATSARRLSRTSSMSSGITYRLAPGTPLSVTVATAFPTHETETSGPEPLERLAAAFYDDLHAIAQREPSISLWQALAAPDTYAEQPDLLARLVSADVEQLLRDQLIAGVALVLGDRGDEPNAHNVPIVRYCATYLLRRVVSPLPNEPIPPPYVRAAEPLLHTSHAGPDTELALLVAWYPAVSPDERAATITFPRYQFQWTPLTAVALDDTALPTHEPDAPRITAGGVEWTRTRLDVDSSRRL
jgi:hypothetical protein